MDRVVILHIILSYIVIVLPLVNWLGQIDLLSYSSNRTEKV